jgi:hypothetical protein
VILEPLCNKGRKLLARLEKEFSHCFQRDASGNGKSALDDSGVTPLRETVSKLTVRPLLKLAVAGDQRDESYPKRKSRMGTRHKTNLASDRPLIAMKPR